MKRILSLFSILLTLALLLPTVSVLAAESAPSMEEQDVLYSLDFSSLSALPEGLEYGYKGKGASFGYVTDSPSLKLSLDENKGTLSVSGEGADSFIAFPEINTDCYLYEAEITVTSQSGSLGLANNIYDSLDGAAAGAQWLAIYIGGSNAPYSIRKAIGTDFQKNEAEVPEDFENLACGQTLTLGLASYGGVNYYYLDGKLICSFPQVAPNSVHGFDRVGFFSYGASYEIKNIRVSELEAPKEEEMKTLTFTLFADFHYKNGMYMSTIADLEAILARADESDSAFIMSAGDFCNDFKGSPELINTYHGYKLRDGSILPAYNVYGNHELETEGNSMSNVTATLTNDESVVWGTPDGEFDENIGYYYFEAQGFRIVCIDTQYSYNPESEQWEHNGPASWGAPSGNTNKCALGPVQLEWLEGVLTEAAEKDIPCIVVGHDGMSGLFATSSSDASAVRGIFRRVNAINPGTVLMCINGHLHTNNQGYNEGVFYLDMNTVRNCLWRSDAKPHYNYRHTFEKTLYDDEGNPTRTVTSNLTEISMGENTWFSADPLSAVVTVSSDGVIKIDGIDSDWIYGVVPDNLKPSCEPRVSSGTYWDCASFGHLADDGEQHWQYDEESHWSTCPSELCGALDNKEAHSFECKKEEHKYLASEENNGDKRYYLSCVCGLAGSETFIVPSAQTPTEPPTETGESEGEASQGSTEPSDKGCGSYVGAGAVVAGATAASCALLKKKKKEK